MPTRAEAWAALTEAMETVSPACSGAAEFTADNPTAEDRAWCAEVCARCPLLELCGAYADAARVRSGFWAGRQRGDRR